MRGYENTSAARRGFFFRFIICCLSFLIVVGILALIFYALGMEPFGDRTVAIDDAKIQYIDFFTYYVDVLRGTRTLSYDFANMLGGSSIGLFSYYLASPFNLLLYYFGKEGVYRFFNIAVVLKLGTAGATFAWYLQRRFEDELRPAFVIALSMGYGLMQYSIAQSSNIMWLDGVYMLPLILLGVYEVFHRKSIWRLALSVAFCILCNWYIAGVICLFTGIWFVFEFFFCGGRGWREVSAAPSVSGDAVPADGSGDGGSAVQEAGKVKEGQNLREDAVHQGDVVLPADRERRKSGPYRTRRRHYGFAAGVTDFVVSFFRYVWGMGLGVAISSVLFIPAVSAIRQGKGQYDKVKFLMEMSGDMLSSVRGYVIGAQSERGFAALFCGGIVVFAVAAFFFSGTVKIRQKIACLGLAGVCFMMLHWEPAMLAFSLLKRADSYWYRYSFLVCFALLFIAGAYLSRADRDRWSRISVLLMSLLYSAAVLKLNGIHLVDFLDRKMALVYANRAVFATVAASVLLAVLTLICICVRKFRFIGFLAGMLAVVITGAELWANAYLFWQDHKDDSQGLYMEYSAGLQKQLGQLRAVDGGYYRIAQDRTRWHYDDDDLTSYFNDSLAQNYWSNTAYTSSPENAQLSLMWRLGYRDEAGCMMIVRDPMVAADSFLGVKYYLQSTPVKGLKSVKGVKAFNGRKVYRNPYALPFAFTYDGSKLPTMRYDNAYVYQNALYSTLSGRDTKIFTPLSWTRKNEGNKSFFRVYIPEGNYLAYGNLLWPEKMGGLMSINGSEPFGYCRWTSPASFLIRSRQEQAKSGKEKSLEAAVKAKKELEKAEKAAAQGQVPAGGEQPEGTQAEEVSGAGSAVEPESAEAEKTPAMKKEELLAAAQAFDKQALAELKAAENASGAGQPAAASGQKKGGDKDRKDKTGKGKTADGTNGDKKDSAGYADVRTVVFQTEKGLSFKDYQFYGLDLNALKEASDRIRTGEVTDLVVENGHVACSVEGRRGQSICLLVPWSKGWQALRNGEVVQPDTVAGTMITIPLVDGENKIELAYTIPYLREGMIVSAGALAVLLLDILCRGIASRRRKRKK